MPATQISRRRDLQAAFKIWGKLSFQRTTNAECISIGLAMSLCTSYVSSITNMAWYISQDKLHELLVSNDCGFLLKISSCMVPMSHGHSYRGLVRMLLVPMNAKRCSSILTAYCPYKNSSTLQSLIEKDEQCRHIDYVEESILRFLYRYQAVEYHDATRVTDSFIRWSFRPGNAFSITSRRLISVSRTL